jgi:hypothetical protein
MQVEPFLSSFSIGHSSFFIGGFNFEMQRVLAVLGRAGTIGRLLQKDVIRSKLCVLRGSRRFLRQISELNELRLTQRTRRTAEGAEKTVAIQT